MAAKAPWNQPRQSADREEKDEGESEEQGRLQVDGPLVQRRDPVKDLDGAGDSNQKGEEGEEKVRKVALAADKHVVPPYQGADRGNGHARIGDSLVAEDDLSGKDRNDIRNDTHCRKNHDIDCGVGVDPEEVLVEQGIAPFDGSKTPTPKYRFQDDEDHR